MVLQWFQRRNFQWGLGGYDPPPPIIRPKQYTNRPAVLEPLVLKMTRQSGGKIYRNTGLLKTFAHYCSFWMKQTFNNQVYTGDKCQTCHGLQPADVFKNTSQMKVHPQMIYLHKNVKHKCCFMVSR